MTRLILILMIFSLSMQADEVSKLKSTLVAKQQQDERLLISMKLRNKPYSDARQTLENYVKRQARLNVLDVKLDRFLISKVPMEAYSAPEQLWKALFVEFLKYVPTN